MPSSGQNGFRRFVSRTSRPSAATVALSVSSGITMWRPRPTGRDDASAEPSGLSCSAFALYWLRTRSRQRRELWRTLSVAYGAGERSVFELLARAGASEEEPSAAHVASADECGREKQPL